MAVHFQIFFFVHFDSFQLCQPGAAYLSLAENTPVIPVYTNGSYFNKKRAAVIIGTPIYPLDYTDPGRTDKENTEAVNAAMREKLLYLEKLLEERQKGKKG